MSYLDGIWRVVVGSIDVRQSGGNFIPLVTVLVFAILPLFAVALPLYFSPRVRRSKEVVVARFSIVEALVVFEIKLRRFQFSKVV